MSLLYLPDERVVNDEEIVCLRRFLSETFPDLVDAPIVATRLCLYCDTRDEHFWIDRHPERRGLVVAAGGSGHGFKFGPLLGGLVADAMEGRPVAKFRWRSFAPDASGEEEARHHG